jgi:hypothetical protein
MGRIVANKTENRVARATNPTSEAAASMAVIERYSMIC